MRWARYVACIWHNIDTSWTLMRKTEGNRLAGRLRRRWHNNIKRKRAVHARQAYVTEWHKKLTVIRKSRSFPLSNVTAIRSNLAVICCLRRQFHGACQSADTNASRRCHSVEAGLLPGTVFNEMLWHTAQCVCSFKTCLPAEQHRFLIFKDISQQKYWKQWDLFPLWLIKYFNINYYGRQQNIGLSINRLSITERLIVGKFYRLLLCSRPFGQFRIKIDSERTNTVKIRHCKTPNNNRQHRDTNTTILAPSRVGTPNSSHRSHLHASVCECT
jgi:hypothetical protein